ETEERVAQRPVQRHQTRDRRSRINNPSASAMTPATTSAGRSLAVAGATEPLLNVVTTGRPGSLASAALSTCPTVPGTGTPDAESTQSFMFVMAVRSTESRVAESADAIASGVGATTRGGPT